jgi:hypothetical protein
LPILDFVLLLDLLFTKVNYPRFLGQFGFNGHFLAYF